VRDTPGVASHQKSEVLHTHGPKPQPETNFNDFGTIKDPQAFFTPVRSMKKNLLL
jgi:hypothetical protein